jgi:DNA-binding CsgD family transcriptional regulator
VFERYGVSGPAEAAYRVLVRNPAAGVPELAAELALPAERVPALLAELTDLGLRAATPDAAIVPPERVVELLIAREEAALERRRRALAELREDADGVVAEFVDGRRRLLGALVEEVRGPDAVRSRLYQLSRDTKVSAWTLNPGPALPEVIIEASVAMDAQARSAGVRSRSVFSVGAVAQESMARYLADVVAAGDTVRVHPDPPLRMLLIDGEVAVIPLDAEDHTRGAYVLHGPDLVAPLAVLFELVWSAAEDLDPVAPRHTDAEGARLRQVVALLAGGHKDEAIARRLGVSVRTTRRLISLAVERLGAESRFQAGVLAVRHGWLPDPG